MLCSVLVMFSQEMCASQIKCVIQFIEHMYGSAKATKVHGRSVSALDSVLSVPMQLGFLPKDPILKP